MGAGLAHDSVAEWLAFENGKQALGLQGPDGSANDSRARQGALSSDELPELGAKSGARHKPGSSGPPTKRRHKS